MVSGGNLMVRGAVGFAGRTIGFAFFGPSSSSPRPVATVAPRGGRSGGGLARGLGFGFRSAGIVTRHTGTWRLRTGQLTPRPPVRFGCFAPQLLFRVTGSIVLITFGQPRPMLGEEQARAEPKKGEHKANSREGPSTG